MRMRENLIDIYKVLTNSEELLRLLYYKPLSPTDSPLDPAKPNILDKPPEEKWEIIMDRIKTTNKTDDLDDEVKCRLLFYPGKRTTTSNYLIADQEIVIDILVHFEFDNVDLRLSWICDTVNNLIFDERITGVGKVTFKSGGQIGAPKNYLGYRLVYEFGSFK